MPTESENVDATTAAALEDETAGGTMTAAPEPEKIAEEPASSVDDQQIGGFADPDYEDIISDRDRSGDVEEEEDTARPLDPQAPAPVAVESESATAAESESTASPPEVPVTAAATPAAPVAEAPTAPASGSQPSPEEQVAAQRQIEAEVLGELMKLYALSPEDAAKLDEFESKPSEYLPQLLAKAHQGAYAHAYQAIMENLPSMVDRISSAKIEQQRYETAFYERWPELKGQDEVSIKAINTYRQMNPGASVQDAIEKGGMLAMVSLGKVPGGAQQVETAAVRQVPPPRPVQPGSTGGRIQTGRPATYEEGVYDEIFRSEQQYGKG